MMVRLCLLFLTAMVLLPTLAVSAPGTSGVRGEQGVSTGVTGSTKGKSSKSSCKSVKSMKNSSKSKSKSKSKSSKSCKKGSFYASNQNGDLFEIDYNTNALADDVSRDHMFGSTEIVYDETTDTLWSTPAGGAPFMNNYDWDGTLLCPSFSTNVSIPGLEYIDGELFGSSFPIDCSGICPSTLVRIDTEKQVLAEVGPTAPVQISGLAYEKTNGTLFGVSLGFLVTINRTTGMYLTAIPITVDGNLMDRVGSISFDGNGALRGCMAHPDWPDELLTIDTATGEATFSGVSLEGLRCTGLTLVCK